MRPSWRSCWLGCWLAAALLACLWAGPAAAAAPSPAATTSLPARLSAGEPIVVHVTIPLCHNEQINCGAGGLGSPGNLRTNLYWGAMFGAKRIFDRRSSGWRPVAQTHAVEGVLERAVYRRQVDGKRWGLAGRTIEQLAVLDALHGAKINDAVKRFFHTASHGADLRIDDGDARRVLHVSFAGYAGHNRLMDGFRLPKVADGARKPVASFVLACLSDRYFSDALRQAGSQPMVMTRSYMAPEGYVVEAAARAFGDNLSPADMRNAVVQAYAKWQRISARQAGRVFAP